MEKHGRADFPIFGLEIPFSFAHIPLDTYIPMEKP
jgi:hypothetical protein